MRLALALLAVGWASCAHRGDQVTSARELDLVGLDAPLLPDIAVRAAVAGQVQGRAAEIRFEFAEPLSLVTRGCFGAGGFTDSGESVTVPHPSGAPRELPLVTVRAVQVGSRPPALLRAGLEPDEQRCTVTLGSDVLAPYALRIDPATRRLRVSASRPRERYLDELAGPQPQGGLESHLLDLSKTPEADWPLLTVRARQQEAQVMGAFLLSLNEPQSNVVAEVAAEAGMEQRSELLEDLPLPASVKLPERLSARTVPVARLELSPGFFLQHGSLRVLDGWKTPAALGLIGSDVWGRFIATVDPGAGLLLLQRPRVFASGTRQQCASTAHPERISEEACFQLWTEPRPDGAEAVVTLWRDAPEGARIYLEALDDKGVPVRSECQVGITFPPTDRGASARHRIPWAALRSSLPACADGLAAARSVVFGLYEEGSLRECPGQCAFVQHGPTRRVSCECASNVLGMTDAERNFLQMYRRLLDRAKSRQQSPAPDRPKFDPPPEGGKRRAPPKDEAPEPEPEE